MTFPDIHLAYVVAGLIVGFIVGMTGVGGGSLMTPILIYLGFPPSSAVGSDLMYAAITNTSGVYVHQKKKNIDWRVTAHLAAGSVPAALITLWVIHLIGFDSKHVNAAIKESIGCAMIFTALAILGKQKLLAWSHSRNAIFTRMTQVQRERTTVVVGIFLGVIVTMTSIGAGAIGTVALFLLYPMLPTNRLVGTEISHALPLTLVAGLGHASVGNVNWDLLINLLMGSLPGIYIGSHLPSVIPDKVMRPTLAVMMMIVGTKMVAF